MTRSTDRALEALEHLADHIVLGVMELAGLMQIDKSSAQRILAALTDRGFAVRDPQTRRYQLGPSAARIGAAYEKSFDLKQTISPYIQRLVEETGETATLAVYDNGAALVIAQYEEYHRFRPIYDVGMRIPIHAGSGCKSLLAYQSHTELERVIREIGLAPLTPYTITDPEQLHHELAQIRRQGYAVSLHELRLDHRSVGVAIFDHRGKAVAGISVSCPLDRYSDGHFSELVAKIVETARRISTRLGFRGDPAGAA